RWTSIRIARSEPSIRGAATARGVVPVAPRRELSSLERVPGDCVRRVDDDVGRGVGTVAGNAGDHDIVGGPVQTGGAQSLERDLLAIPGQRVDVDVPDFG